MSIRLLLDEDVPILLAVALRERGFDVLHVTEAGLSGATDPVVFEWAVQERRSVVTHNARHFLPLVEHAAGLGQDHFGLLPVAQLPLGELLRRALRTLRGRSAEDLTNAVVWLV
jgi:predicted nuclease of predicted toxin-antitoxin system